MFPSQQIKKYQRKLWLQSLVHTQRLRLRQTSRMASMATNDFVVAESFTLLAMISEM